jgi:site-specific recombinase XerD
MVKRCSGTQHYPRSFSLFGKAGQGEEFMIEKFFTQQQSLRRLREGIFGPHLPAIAGALHQAQYSTASIRVHLRAADHFGAWLEANNIGLDGVDEVTVARYIDGLKRQYSMSSPRGRRPNSALGLAHLIEVLRQAGVLKPARGVESQSSVEAWLADFEYYLDHVAGCAPGSRGNYLRYARRFLQEVFGDQQIEWSRLTGDRVSEFVRRQAAKLRPSACGQPVTAIRSLIRFLASKGAVPAGLQGAVPPVRTWRHSALPRTISAHEVERVLGAYDAESKYGLRERAIVLLLARLGLRAGEVIRLRIDDIDWVHGCVLVRAGKTHRERSLPLTQEVGDALATYLRDARPATMCRELFLRWRPPFRPLCRSVSICTLVQKLLKRANISVHRPGAHTLRHTLATGMAINGVTFKAIADVLGHGSIASTEIYAKLDLRSLSEVAMPWPGGAK